MTAGERVFLDRHRDYDRAYTPAFLARWLVHTQLGLSWPEVAVRLRGTSSAGLSPAAADIVTRHRRAAVVFADFFEALVEVTKSTPYPAEELSAVPGASAHR